MKIRGFEIVKDCYRRFPKEMINLPKRATKNSAAYDFYSPEDIIIEPKTKYLIWTDVKMYCLPDEELVINVRSSMGKQPVMLANTQGWIDSDYYGNIDNDGNIGINLYNLGEKPYVIKKGDRIAQGAFQKILLADDDNAEGKRIGGFGSTKK